MADPTIQTFCCHHVHSVKNVSDNNVDIITRIMLDFDSDAYNIVCTFSACLGIIGAVYQILPRKQLTGNHRLASASAVRSRRIIVWLAVADLMASLGILGRASLWMTLKSLTPVWDDSSSGFLVCALSSAWTQYFYTATWIWTLCYAIDMRRILAEQPSIMAYYHIAAWIIPAVLTSLGLTILYLPDAECHTMQLLSRSFVRILPNYLATYMPIVIVMIANPCLYQLSSKDAQRTITSCYSQITGRERDLIDALRIKFFVINSVFYICWLPNLINGILLWSLWFRPPVRFIVTIWYVIAFTNPLQALFNCLVYRRWCFGSEKMIALWACDKSQPQRPPTTKSTSLVKWTFFGRSLREEHKAANVDERRPLLIHTASASCIVP